MLAELFLERVRDERRDDRAAPRQYADEKSQQRSPRDWRSRRAPFLPVRQETSNLCLKNFGLDGLFDIDENLSDPEKSHGHQNKLEPVAELVRAIGESLGSLDRVEPDHSEQETDAGHHQPFGHRSSRQVADQRKSEDKECEVLRRS